MSFIRIDQELKMSETDTHVFFLNGPFSQWYPSDFKANLFIDGDEAYYQFNCAEQYMMARKAALFGDMDTLAKILQVEQHRTQWREAPKKCKKLGREVKGFDQQLWDENCDEIVFDGNFSKFDQNPVLKNFLLSFSGRELVEGADYDPVWGVGLAWNNPHIIDPANWQGENKLGIALMAVRNVLRLTNAF